MADNKQIKDGLGNIFTIRMRDISSALDGTVQRSMILSTPYPLDYGNSGFYQFCAKSGVMLAAAPANSPILSFRWFSGTAFAVINRVRLWAWSNTAFGAGVSTFDIYAARAFTGADTGENSANLVGDSNQLRTTMGASGASIVYSNTVPITPGTRILDAAPLDSSTVQAPTTANTMFGNMPMTLFEKREGDHPLVLAFNEGFVVRTTMASLGAWNFSMTLEWAEMPTY
jgi:hypothetical protein